MSVWMIEIWIAESKCWIPMVWIEDSLAAFESEVEAQMRMATYVDGDDTKRKRRVVRYDRVETG